MVSEYVRGGEDTCLLSMPQSRFRGGPPPLYLVMVNTFCTIADT